MMKQQMTKRCYAAQIDLIKEEAELNKAKALRLRRMEEELKQNLQMRKVKQQEILLETFYKHKETLGMRQTAKQGFDNLEISQLSGYTDST